MRDYLYIGTVLVLSVLILFRPWWGILAWTVFGLVNPWEYTYSAQHFRFALYLGGATLIGMVLTSQRRRLPITTQTVLLALLPVWFTMTTLHAWAQDVAWEQWDRAVKMLLMAAVTPVLIYGRKRIKALVLTIVLMIGFFGVKGGMWSILTGGANKVMGPGESGYISGNAGIGIAILMILPLVHLMAQGQRRTAVRLGIWASFWLLAIAAVFTYSRGVLLGLGAVMFLLFFRVKRKALVFLLVVPALIFAYQYVPKQLVNRAETIETYQEDGSAMARIQSWGVAWNVARANFLGAGFGFDTQRERWLSYANFRDEQGNFSYARTAHSIYFQMLGDHGFVGLLLLLMLLASTYRTFGSISGRIESVGNASGEDIRWLGQYAYALQIGLVGYAVAGAFFSLAYFDLFYMYVALAVILQRECRDHLMPAPHARARSGNFALLPPGVR